MAIVKYSEAQIDVLTDEEEIEGLNKAAKGKAEEIHKALAKIEEELKESGEHDNN